VWPYCSAQAIAPRTMGPSDAPSAIAVVRFEKPLRPAAMAASVSAASQTMQVSSHFRLGVSLGYQKLPASATSRAHHRTGKIASGSRVISTPNAFADRAGERPDSDAERHPARDHGCERTASFHGAP